MSKKIKGLLRNFVIFIVLLALGHLADNLPDAIWCLAIQIGLYGAALVVGIRQQIRILIIIIIQVMKIRNISHLAELLHESIGEVRSLKDTRWTAYIRCNCRIYARMCG